jgi:hypothetical protein
MLLNKIAAPINSNSPRFIAAFDGIQQQNSFT